ncbi:MAG TPA: phosphoadenylyl-sulfate reductase [Acidiphilium sp.]
MPETPTALEDGSLALLRRAIETDHTGRIALVSSFGTESAVLLHLIARIDRRLPVIFLDTGKLFPDTIAYRNALITRLRLTDVRSIRPDPRHLADLDPDGTLFARDPDLCCAIRKTMPLDTALEGFDAWISGRKRGQTETRATIAASETGPDGRIVINPLRDWARADIEAYFATHDLPRHPLESDGFASIGCFSCTRRINPGEDPRAGRWSGTGKTECGIFLARPVAA